MNFLCGDVNAYEFQEAVTLVIGIQDQSIHRRGSNPIVSERGLVQTAKPARSHVISLDTSGMFSLNKTRTCSGLVRLFSVWLVGASGSDLETGWTDLGAETGTAVRSYSRLPSFFPNWTSRPWLKDLSRCSVTFGNWRAFRHCGVSKYFSRFQERNK